MLFLCAHHGVPQARYGRSLVTEFGVADLRGFFLQGEAVQCGAIGTVGVTELLYIVLRH
jgi:hypothetical protein